jgi:hypothetical protein
MTTKAKKMKFATKKAGNTKKVKENLKKGGNYGRMLWVPADDSKSVLMLVEPKEWDEYKYYMVETTDSGKKLGFKGKLPDYDGVQDDVPEAGRLNPRIGYVIPVVVLDDEGKPRDQVMFWEPGKKMLNELLTIFEKRKTLTDRVVEIIREGSGRDTTYTLYWDDPLKPNAMKKLVKVAEADEGADFSEQLVTMVNDFMKLYLGDEEEEAEEAPKRKKAAAAKKRAMRDEEPEEEDEAEEEPEEEDDDEESEEETSDEEEEGEGSALSGIFEVTEVDSDAFTVDLVHVETGQVCETAYLDRTRDDISDIEEGSLYTTSVSQDDEGDWMVDTVLTPAKAKKGAKKKATATK